MHFGNIKSETRLEPLKLNWLFLLSLPESGSKKVQLGSQKSQKPQVESLEAFLFTTLFLYF